MNSRNYSCSNWLKYLNAYLSLLLLLISVDSTAMNSFEVDILEKEKDSLISWIASSQNKKLSLKKRKAFIDKAYNYSKIITNDSLRNNHLLNIAFVYSKLKDSSAFRIVNKQSIELSIKINDSTNLANNYWDLGRFYSKNGIKDSAYYYYSKAQIIYEAKENNYYSGRMFLNMAIMQSDIKDYTGSEITTTKAISLLKPLKEYKHLYRCYNNLGIAFDELEEHERALFYHNKALEYQQKINKKNTYKQNTLNNIGVSYELQKKYKEAINYYELALGEGNLEKENIRLYAKLLDNLTYSKLKIGDTINSKASFFKTLKIRDSIDDYLGIAVNKLHLASYYTVNKDTLSAIQYANETKVLAVTTKNNRELLASLLLLSKLDKKNNYYYTNAYIKLSDSLQKQERAIRNKFARIRFETDEFIVENERLSEQKKLLILLSIFVALFGLLLLIIRSQRSKNKRLQFEQQQQSANEEIYNLMITQQYKLDEGKRKEKERISQELHDGVLGKLFGARLILSTLNEKADKESVLKREKYINDLQSIEEEVRNVSHELHAKSLASDVGYTHMIDNLLENQSSISNFNYKFIYDKSVVWEEIKGSLKMNLFRILQEAIQNINKYAEATNVLVEFKVEGNYLYLVVKDDGIGFDATSKSSGIGLKNMKSRITTLKGEMTISSQQNKGTKIVFKVPYGEKSI